MRRLLGVTNSKLVPKLLRRSRWAIGGAALLAAVSLPVQAYDLPAVNLGFTSFLDGAPPAGPGWYAQQYVQFYRNGRLTDPDGNRLQIPKPPPGGPLSQASVDANIGITQLIYQSDQELLAGGKWGINLMLPYAGFDSDHPAITTNSGIGDLLVGPYLQWDPIMGERGPLLVQRVELQLLLPTGDYKSDRSINPGSNVFSFNPYWAGTAFLGERWTASWRLHYLWNDKNSDPNPLFNASNSQAGQAFHVNFASAYEVLPNQLRVGINGYYLKQVSSSKIDGQNRPGKEQVFAIGPGLVYHFSRHNHLFVNAYQETCATVRPKGTRANLRFVHHFR